MRIRTLARRAALGIPPVRRLWDFAMAEARRADELTIRIGTLTERADTLMGELTTVSDERDSLELQLYVLRSDHQRTLARADATRQEMSELRARLAQAGDKSSQSAPADLDALLAQLTDRMRCEFAAMAAQLRGAGAASIAQDVSSARYLDLLEKSLTGRFVGQETTGQIACAVRPAAMHTLRLLAERGTRRRHPGRRIRVWCRPGRHAARHPGSAWRR